MTIEDRKIILDGIVKACSRGLRVNLKLGKPELLAEAIASVLDSEERLRERVRLLEALARKLYCQEYAASEETFEADWQGLLADATKEPPDGE